MHLQREGRRKRVSKDDQSNRRPTATPQTTQSDADTYAEHIGLWFARKANRDEQRQQKCLHYRQDTARLASCKFEKKKKMIAAKERVM